MPKKRLFTCIVEFKGGTYIQQVDAASVDEAFEVWRVEALPGVAKLSGLKVSRLREALTPSWVSVTECVNVWCLSSSIGRDLLLMNIVGTLSVPMQKSKE